MELRPGYKQTEVGVIPEEWEVDSIGNAFEVCNHLRLPISQAARERMTGPYPYYGPTNIQGYINEYRVDGEYALIGEDGDHFLKWREQSMTLLVKGKFNVNNHAHIIKGAKNLTGWFYWYFAHNDITPYLSRQGAGRFKLNKKTLTQIPCVADIINEILEANGQVVEDVIDDLTTISHWEYKDGGTPRYDIGACYVEGGINNYQVEEEWSYFRYELGHRSRFFNDSVRLFLDKLMHDLEHVHVPRAFGESVIRIIQPDQDIEYYRARLADKPNELHAILKTPSTQLGPPPPDLAIAGRMNAHGISVFYGSLDRKTCVAELRPSLGSVVVSGAFTLKNPVRVLDFQMLEKSYFNQPLSYFQPDYDERVTYRLLLRRLHSKIRQPILPGLEHEYLVTQVLADYLVNVLKPSVDGILFSSVQNESGINVVLFGHILDIQTDSDSTAVMGLNSALRFKDNSINIHRIKSIEYGSIDHEPKDKGQNLNLDPDEYPDCDEF